MSKVNTHSADGSFLGFLFQIERVLLWLSEGFEHGKVGIETDDDIVIQLKNGEEINHIYEQAKNAQTTGLPFSDKSEDLWKTLSIWVTAVVEKKINIETSIFSAITNKKLPLKRLLFELSSTKKENKVEMDLLILKLKGIAGNLSKENEKFGKIIIDCDNKLLAKIVDKITVFDGTYHHERKLLKSKLKSNLSMSNTLPFDHIYNGLFGHVTNMIIDHWRKGEEAWIEVEYFNKLYSQLVSEFQRKSFLEKATQLLPVDNKQVDFNKNSLYVEQLKLINCEENEILEAIHDYLRSKSEKNRYAKEFEVTESKFLDYYEDLKQHWTNISRPRFKINSHKLTSEDIGYEVFYATISYKGKLNNQEPEQSYTYKGAYHHLTNEFQIGWHPSWEDKLKVKKQ
jgi:hypothetical protein